MKSKNNKRSHNDYQVNELVDAMNEIQSIIREIERNALHTTHLILNLRELINMAPKFVLDQSLRTDEPLLLSKTISRGSSPIYNFPIFGTSLLDNLKDNTSNDSLTSSDFEFSDLDFEEAQQTEFNQRKKAKHICN